MEIAYELFFIVLEEWFPIIMYSLQEKVNISSIYLNPFSTISHLFLAQLIDVSYR